MAEIKWTEEAFRWLRDIHDYIASDNPDAARKVITGIYEKVQILRKFPGLGSTYRLEADGRICIMLYGHYRIAYLIRNEDQIVVLGVFHGALDIGKYLP